MSTEIETNLTKLRNDRDLSCFDLYSVDQLTTDDIELIFAVARGFRAGKTAKLSLNKGKTQFNCFFEPSTRTQASFDLSAKHLSMDTTNVGGSSSALSKGESYVDTVQTLDSYNPATIIIRSSESGVSEVAARHTRASVINAGDGWHEHPTQGLLDALTMVDYFESADLTGRTVTIVGDFRHSRVFGSLVRMMHTLGATVRIAGPATLMPEQVEQFGVTVYHDIEAAVADVDVVYALRVQAERGSKGYIPSLREHSKTFGITEARMVLAKSDAILMHAGPVIRDIDVHSALVSRYPKSRILTQVENGMAVRKAVLWLLCNRLDGRTKEYQPM